MSASVFLHPDLPACAVGDIVVVGGSEGHHAMAVQRLRAGERVDVVDGRGTRVTGLVDATSTPRELRVCVESVVHEAARSPRIVVVQAIPKSDRGELAVELLTEVGVDAIVPWQAEHCVARWSGDRGMKAHGRWVTTAREATKQSRRSHVPDVEPACTTPEVLVRVREAVGRGAQVWMLHEAADAGMPSVSDATEIWLIVGPEGGISPHEVTELVAAGAVPVRLGSTVFRSSSAGTVAAAVVSTLTGRWSDVHARMT